MAQIGDNTVSVIEEVADTAPGSDAAIVRLADETLPPGVSQIDFDNARPGEYASPCHNFNCNPCTGPIH